jgi:hypothetical protein
LEAALGVLNDYLRAPGAEAVVRAMEEETKRNMFEMGLLDVELPDDGTGDLSFGEGLAALEKIDAQGVYDDALLPELIAVIRRVPISRGMVEWTMVWPTTPPPGAEGPDEDDPHATGPWVTELGTGVRDTLASVDDAELSDIATRWGRTDAVREFGAEPDVLLALVERLVRFAREARANDEQLYCWTSL